MGSVKKYFDAKNPECVSQTEQSHKNECDINKIVARALKSGVLPVVSDRGLFGDFSNVDYQNMQIKIARAKEQFMRLPVNIRTRFSNDVGSLLEFIDNPDNKEEAVKLGLLRADEVKPDLSGEKTDVKDDAGKATAV